jgi:hypothetical protein
MSINRRVKAAGAVSSGADVGRPPNGVPVDIRGNGAKNWSPTVANLLVLVVLEIVAFGVIRYAFKRLT